MSDQRGRTDAAAHPARLPPPLFGECLLGWGAEDWNWGAPLRRVIHMRPPLPRHSHALRVGMRPQPRTITWVDPARTVPWPGVCWYVYMAHWQAGPRGCEQTK